MRKSLKNIVHFIFELGQLKHEVHSGWCKPGVKYPETVAEHTCRASQTGYILAALEGANPEKVAVMLLIHDISDTRTHDLDRLAKKYFPQHKKAELRAFLDQLKNLPLAVQEKWLEYFKEFEAELTLEAKVAKDADVLDLAFQAKEYLESGFKGASHFLNSVGPVLRTKSAKNIFAQLKKSNVHEWYLKAGSP